MKFPVKPPSSEEELLSYCKNIAGKTLQELADDADIEAPNHLLRAKGWLGQLLEYYLGTTAGNKSEPDFNHLQIELKSIPVTHNFSPKETTYVCVVPLNKKQTLHWRNSIVYKKLQRVLWVPVQAEKTIPVPERRIGMGALWSPSIQQEYILQKDWEEHMEKIMLGEIDTITAHQGQYLQIRPKAANAKSRTLGIDQNGKHYYTLPRGFYLRTQLTTQILSTSYL